MRNKYNHRCIQALLCGLCPKECSRVHPLNVSERLSIVFAVGYVPRGIESLDLRACDSCKTSINGRSTKLRYLPNASLSMCTHFPALFGDSKRLVLRDFNALRQQLNSIRGAVEQRGVTALPCGIQDDRRSVKDKVELLPRYPGSQIVVANRFALRFLFLDECFSFDLLYHQQRLNY